MVTIWSFHLQYQEPPPIYLKAPTMLYAFILIALRTLRFEPWLVMLAGSSAAAGWLVLVAYAVLARAGRRSPTTSRPTRCPIRSCSAPRSTRSCP